MEKKSVEKVKPGSARKRPRQVDKWKRSIQKQERYSPSSLPVYPTCKHKQGAFKCTSLTMRDVLSFHRVFYNHKDKIKQDNVILQFCEAKVPKKRKSSILEHQKPYRRSLTFKYFVRKEISGEYVPVCRNTLLGILCIKRERLQGVLRRSYNKGGESAIETRGGDRKSKKNEKKRISVQNFIESLKGSEPHYCRSKSYARVYLEPELNTKKLWRMYNSSVATDLKVKECFFRNEFNTKYNIGFGSPRTDVCSTCLEYQENLKRPMEEALKNKSIAEYRVHKLRAQAFFEILRREEEHCITFSFDCQKNMILPKLPDSSAYFSSQINLYNFCIVTGTSKSKLSKDNVHCYVWNETERLKGSNEIASAVYHRLNNADLNGITKITLIADGCGGQNKNTSLICMLMKWLSTNLNASSVNEIILVFPVVGHSFIPPDRVFAQIEKKIRKQEVIVQAEEYMKIIEEDYTVFKLTEDDVIVYNWKEEAKSNLKLPGSWHFPFNMSKRFILRKTKGNVSVRGEMFYKSDTGVAKLVTKTGKSAYSIKPSILPTGIKPNEKKMKSIFNLLQKHFGENWRNLENLQFYVNVDSLNAVSEDDFNDLLLCERQEHDKDLHV